MQKLPHISPPAGKGESGFSLAELLVVLALIAVVLGFVSGGIRFGTRVWERTTTIDESSALEAARNVLRNCLEAASPLGSFDHEGRPRREFTGTNARLSLVCPLGPAPASGVAGLHHVELYLAEVGKEPSLVISVRPFVYRSKPDDEGTAADTHVLADSIVGMSLRYFADMQDGNGARWHDRWPASGGLPQLVGVSLDFAAGDRRVWPELVVSIKVAPSRSALRAIEP